MEDIIEKVKKLEHIGLLEKISKTYPTVQKENEFSLENSSQLHIEAQTYLLAEILQELRKMNNPPIFNFSAASSLWSGDTRPDNIVQTLT